MARYALIDGYLDTMRNEMRWRRDLDDVVYEMEDHLYSAVEHLVTRGAETRQMLNERPSIALANPRFSQRCTPPPTMEE